ncbi:MAG: hypothetical protein C5B59_09595 [Bacteroidetes bacterium]|nr:MAG: hypothetical protein C5B59_09595 [Bacteroidota bacterium]
MSDSVRVHILEPCLETWKNMSPTPNERFCPACMKEVIDFSEMNDDQIFRYLKNSTGKVCGHFYADQLNRNIKKPSEQKSWFKYVFKILIPARLLSERSHAQAKPKEETQACSKSFMLGYTPTISRELSYGNQDNIAKNVGRSIRGRVVDENGEGIPFATVLLVGTMNGQATDIHGNFSIYFKAGQDIILRVSSVGFESYESQFTTPINDLKIVLRQSFTGQVVTGGTTADRKSNITIVEKCRGLLQKLTDMDTVRIFPNPVPAGTSMQIAFDVKKAGETYLLMMTSISGQVILTKKLLVRERKQTNSIQVPIHTQGNYAVQVVNLSTNRSFSSKVIVL